MHSTGWPPVPSMGDGCEDGSCADGSRADWLEPGGGLIDGTRSCGSFAWCLSPTRIGVPPAGSRMSSPPLSLSSSPRSLSPSPSCSKLLRIGRVVNLSFLPGPRSWWEQSLGNRAAPVAPSAEACAEACAFRPVCCRLGGRPVRLESTRRKRTSRPQRERSALTSSCWCAARECSFLRCRAWASDASSAVSKTPICSCFPLRQSRATYWPSAKWRTPRYPQFDCCDRINSRPSVSA
mmetsp:Transcript_67214/g.149969  ORF Transcript_67214/g.149969 Transcript_67214/m.149969 type:complete len:236 (+) Transcript_67214:815-1522(+)